MRQKLHLKPGLCSVTFRALKAEEIVSLAAGNGIEGIEWAGDTHVLPGDTNKANHVAQLCADHQIDVPSYGSYIRSQEQDEFTPVLDTCQALGAGNVRIWAGTKGFDETSDAEKADIADRIRNYCDTAKNSNVTISLEYHPNTMTDSLEGTVWLLDRIANDNCYTYWQPVPEQSITSCVHDITTLAPRLSHIHLFYWSAGRIRQPLADGAKYWSDILSQPTALPNNAFTKNRWAFMEFVREDNPQNFANDSRTFLKLLSKQNARGGGLHNANESVTT